MTWHFCYSESMECVCAACAVYDTVKHSDTVGRDNTTKCVCVCLYVCMQIRAQNL